MSVCVEGCGEGSPLAWVLELKVGAECLSGSSHLGGEPGPKKGE